MAKPVPATVGDAGEAWELAVVVRHVLGPGWPQCAAILRYFGVPEVDREDLLQEVLLALVCKWENIEKPLPWIFQALRLQCRRYARGQRDRIRREQGMRAAAGSSATTTQDEALARRLDLATALDELSPRPRRLLYLRYACGFSRLEAAHLLGYQHSSIKRTANRALRRVRARLASRPPPGT